jgi:hypothetical protein
LLGRPSDDSGLSHCRSELFLFTSNRTTVQQSMETRRNRYGYLLPCPCPCHNKDTRTHTRALREGEPPRKPNRHNREETVPPVSFCGKGAQGVQHAATHAPSSSTPTKLRPKIFLVIFLSVARADARGPTYRPSAPGGPQRRSRGIEEKPPRASAPGPYCYSYCSADLSRTIHDSIRKARRPPHCHRGAFIVLPLR